MSPNDPTRRFTVLIASTSGAPSYGKTVDAAYWQYGLTADSVQDDQRVTLIVFKDQAGKPVFAVRADLVETITEERGQTPTFTATGNVTLCTCGVMTGGHVVHRSDCPMEGAGCSCHACTMTHTTVVEVAA